MNSLRDLALLSLGAPASLEPWVIAGPTASGKSALAIDLAERLGGEIVCGDSRQVYAGMRVGAAGPSDAERRRVPHHGYHEVDPRETYDAGRFLVDTDRHIADIQARGRVPLIVGGSGLYLRSWRFGLPDVPPSDAAVRARLEAELREQGPGVLHARLQRIDPSGSARIASGDGVRIVRALEIWEVSGRAPSELRPGYEGASPRHEARWLLLEAPAPWLEGRLAARAQEMFAAGLPEEALALVERVGRDHRLLGTMGYEEALGVAEGTLTAAAALERTVTRQRQYARRQRTWFRKETWWTRVDASAARARLLGQ